MPSKLNMFTGQRYQFTGIIIITMIFLIGVSLVGLSLPRTFFANDSTYCLLLPEEGTFGLKSGDDVIILGMPAGKVSEVIVDREKGLSALLSIRGDFSYFIRKDSKVTIRKTLGIVGNSYLEISKGIKGEFTEQVPTLHCNTSDDLPDALKSFMDDVKSDLLPMVVQANESFKIWGKLGDGLILSNEKLHNDLELLGKILDKIENAEGSPSEQILGDDAYASMLRVLSKSEENMSEFHTLLRGLQRVTVNLPEASDSLKTIPEITQRITEILYESQRLVEGAQQHWIVKPYIKEEKNLELIPLKEMKAK